MEVNSNMIWLTEIENIHILMTFNFEKSKRRNEEIKKCTYYNGV
jgi:hypothetical protein